MYPTILFLIRTRDHKSDKIDPLKRHMLNIEYQKHEIWFRTLRFVQLQPNILNILIRQQLVRHIEWKCHCTCNQNDILIFFTYEIRTIEEERSTKSKKYNQ